MKTLRQIIALPIFFVGIVALTVAAFIALDEDDFQR